MAIDTLAYVKALERAGIDRTEAEAHLKAMQDAIVPVLATKADINSCKAELRAEISALRTELKAEISGVRTELKAEIAEVRTELKATEIRLDSKIDKVVEQLRATIWQSSLAMLVGCLTIGGFPIRFLR